MNRVFFAWLFSILLGGFNLSLLSLIYGFRIDEAFVAFIVSFFYSIVFALPLLITETYLADKLVKSTRNFKKYTIIKYSVAFIILLIVFFVSIYKFSEYKNFEYAVFVISFCYGIPGYILHVKYLKPHFKVKHSLFLEENKSSNV
jgi:hypothetical protein